MSKITIAQYDGTDVAFTDEGWFNATEVAAKYGKLPNEWTRLPETKRYLAALERKYGKIPHLKAQRGRASGGTWLHPRLGVRFAQWLDIDFAIWCDEQIDKLLRGDALDLKRAKHEATASTKVMQAVRKMDLEDRGKEPKRHHFINEARLVNFALSGEFKGLDRDAMTVEQLDKLARIEERNTVLIARGMPYDDRKTDLQKFAANWQRLPSGRGNHMLRG